MSLPTPLTPADAGGELLLAVQADPIRNPYRAYLDQLKAGDSHRKMATALDRIARLIRGADLDDQAVTGADFPWHRLRYEHTSRIRARLVELELSPAYTNQHLVALRRVLKEAWRLELMTAEDYRRAADISNMRGTREPAGQHIPEDVIDALFAVFDDDTSLIGARDRALLAVLYSTGVRREELVKATVSNYDSGARSLRVRGKGDKERTVYLTEAARDMVEAWLARRGRTTGALFPPIRRGDHVQMNGARMAHMTGQAIRKIVIKRLAQAGASPRTPHDFRRTFIGELLDAGVDLATAQDLVGHSSPTTTARYDRRPHRKRREAVDRLRAPGSAK
ncbi:tyrosine-type recombinase/integrase (plasmid) [Streptosporangium sandarakinum]|uniref:tyrosine-type recombinase/integrase n=1 Tax=Streptosporangium sandarakinum TaxID=1260955 RepID=UPI003D8BC6D4